MGRCGAPCEGSETVAAYARHVDAVRVAFTADPHDLVRRLLARIDLLAAAHRYEEAAVHRDRMSTFVRTAAPRASGSPPSPPCRTWPLPVGSRREAGAARRPARSIGRGRSRAVRRASAPVPRRAHGHRGDRRAGSPPLPAATVEEAECVLRWLETPGTRLVEVDGVWALPAGGAGGLTGLVSAPGWATGPPPVR